MVDDLQKFLDEEEEGEDEDEVPAAGDEEEDDGARLPEVEQRERADDGDEHGALHIEDPLVDDAGQGARDQDGHAHRDARQAEVRERVGVPRGALGSRPDAAGDGEEDEAHEEERALLGPHAAPTQGG